MSNNYPEKCHVVGCPCHEWSAKSPSESLTTSERDAGFLVPGAENVSSSLLTQSTAISAPTFEQEWESAPRAMIRYVESSVAEYWFLRGVRAGEAGAIVAMNQDLKEISRVAGERLQR